MYARPYSAVGKAGCGGGGVGDGDGDGGGGDGGDSGADGGDGGGGGGGGGLTAAFPNRALWGSVGRQHAICAVPYAGHRARGPSAVFQSLDRYIPRSHTPSLVDVAPSLEGGFFGGLSSVS